MSNEIMMDFPETWEEYEQQYGFTDTDEVYTNGSRLIPSFRVKQWLDHLSVPERGKGEWVSVVDREDEMIKENHWECSKCGSGKSGWGEYKFCPDCGADMRGEI